MKFTTEQLQALLPHFGEEGDGTSEDGYSPYANLRPDEVRDLIEELTKLRDALYKKESLIVSFEPEEVGAMVKELNELRAALHQTDHFIVLSENGWSIEHTVKCRKDGMTNCPYHRAAERVDLRHMKPGRYRCYLNQMDNGEEGLALANAQDLIVE